MYKVMKKRKIKQTSSGNPVILELEFNDTETLKIMEKGTNVSCNLIDVLTHSGDDVVGMAAAVFGLAKATVLIKKLMERKGFDMTGIYDDVKAFFEEYAETVECEECFEKHGL